MGRPVSYLHGVGRDGIVRGPTETLAGADVELAPV